MSTPGTGSEIDGFRVGEMIHAGSMASIYRLTGARGALPLIIKIPRLGAGERAVNVIAFEVCKMVLGALAQGPHHPTLVAFGDVETTPYLVMEYVPGARLNGWVQRAPIEPGARTLRTFSYLKRKAEGQSYLRMLGHARARSVILIFLGIFLI
jgi:non-specific serine/threonine protein kinase/protein-serine/threonine kinase